MRSLLFCCEMLALLPIALVRPFVGVLIFSFISFSNLHRLSWGFATDLPWAYMAVFATLIGCIVAGEPKRLTANPTSLLILAFVLCVLLTSLTALAPAELVWTKWEAVSKVFAFLLLTGALLTDRHRIHALLWVMVISLGYYGVKGGGFTLLTGGGARILGPPSSIIADNNHLAAGLLVTLPVMNYLRLQSAHRLVRIGLLTGMVLTLFAVLGSYSRGALLGLSAVAFTLWLRSPNKILTGSVVIVTLVLAIHFMPESWTTRMSTIETYNEDASATTRLTMWRAAFAMAVGRPLTGAGFMGPYSAEVMARFMPGAPARAVHSIWFELLGEHGFPTFAVWLAIIAVAVVNTVRIRREVANIPDLRWCGDLARMTQVSIVAYVVSGTFLSLSYWDFFFTLLVVVAATRVLVRDHVRAPAGAGGVAAAGWRRRAAGGAMAGKGADLGPETGVPSRGSA